VLRRKASAYDFDSIYEIMMDPAVNPFLNVEPMARDALRPIFNELLNRGNLSVYEQDGTVIGLVELSRGRRRTGHAVRLDNLAIRSESQGRGWGTQLLQDIITELQSQGVKRIDLIVESDNARAIRLYQKLGFEIEGTLRKYFKRAYQNQFVDDYLMAIIFD